MPLGSVTPSLTEAAGDITLDLREWLTGVDREGQVVDVCCS